ncbi:carbamoyl phosphate synthetase subunit large, partial [Neisseria gonorrhoeae]
QTKEFFKIKSSADLENILSNIEDDVLASILEKGNTFLKSYVTKQPSLIQE